MQVRLLDARGKELIKANRDEHGISLTPSRALQNKSTKTYFKASKRLQAGDIYISAINLNREHGKISLPIHRYYVALPPSSMLANCLVFLSLT